MILRNLHACRVYRVNWTYVVIVFLFLISIDKILHCHWFFIFFMFFGNALFNWYCTYYVAYWLCKFSWKFLQRNWDCIVLRVYTRVKQSSRNSWKLVWKNILRIFVIGIWFGSDIYLPVLLAPYCKSKAHLISLLFFKYLKTLD